MQDLQRVRYVTQNYGELQGLKSVGAGLFLLFLVALYEEWLPGSPWVLNSFLVLLLPFCMLGVVALLFRSIQRYYERTFGHVEPDPERVRRERRRSLIIYFLLFISHSLDRTWQPAISIWGLVFAGFFLGTAWTHRAYQIHYIVTAVLLAGLSLLPLGGISLDSTGTIISVAAGLMFIVIGCIDHALLVRTFKPVPEESNGARI